jgi:hypothetical protein
MNVCMHVCMNVCMYDKRVLRKTCGPKKDAVTAYWWRLRSVLLRDL